MFFKSGKIKAFIYIIILALIAGFFFFNKYGIVKYLDLYNQKQALEKQIMEAEKENDRLKAEIDSLKTQDIKIEKVAREKYNMKRKGEKVFRVEEK